MTPSFDGALTRTTECKRQRVPWEMPATCASLHAAEHMIASPERTPQQRGSWRRLPTTLRQDSGWGRRSEEHSGGVEHPPHEAAVPAAIVQQSISYFHSIGYL